VVVKETEPVPGMLLISPQAVMFEPTDSQPQMRPQPQPSQQAPADDEETGTETGASGTTPAQQRDDWIIVPMDSISSIMISHQCTAGSTRSACVHRLLSIVSTCAARCVTSYSVNSLALATQRNARHIEARVEMTL